MPNGGLFSATGLPLITYIAFAYKITGDEGQLLRKQLPGWAATDPFDIQARADGRPGKDDMRLMMRALLADRFRLAVHTETREVPVLAMLLLKPGKPGPQLQPHPGGSSCSLNPADSGPGIAGGFPALCGGIVVMPPATPGNIRAGARNITLPFLANAMTGMAQLGQPLADKTGLSGTFDFVLEWTPETRAPSSSGADAQFRIFCRPPHSRRRCGTSLESGSNRSAARRAYTWSTTSKSLRKTDGAITSGCTPRSQSRL